MRVGIVVVLLALLGLSAGGAVASASSGGNSANAKLCQKGGWTTLARSEDSSAFANQGDCVSYAAHGGTLVTKGRSQLYCESLAGVFSTDPASSVRTTPWDGEQFAWSCLGAQIGIGIQAFNWFTGFQLNCVGDVGDGIDAGAEGWWTIPTPGVLYYSCYKDV